jgi:ParB/RepB/Spo0J family partition protein
MSEDAATTTAQETTQQDAPAEEPAKKDTTPAKAKKNTTPAKPKFDEGKQTGTILDVPIASIVRYDNPRKEPENLYSMGFILFGDPNINESGEVDDPEDENYGKFFYLTEDSDEPHYVDELTEEHYVSLYHLAIDPEYAPYYVELIDTYESVDRNKFPMAPQSIKELSEDIESLGQLVPILIRKEKDGYIGIDGGRRIAAILYLHAKGLAGDGHKFPAIVKATTDACKQGDVFLHSLKANLSRKDFTPLQEGLVYHQMLQQTNPKTGRKWTMKDAAEELKVEYGTFRNRAALWNDYDPETKKGLTDSQRQKVATGEWGVTAAARKALGEKHYADNPAPAETRRKPLPLKVMEQLFDQTAEANEERRIALAQCMGYMKDEDDKKGLQKAVKESESRIAAQDEAEIRRG